MKYKLFLIIDKPITPWDSPVASLLQTLGECNYVSLNWDILLEKSLYLQGKPYGVDETIVNINNGKLKSVSYEKNESTTRIAKVHGSANWAYCDNCHKIYSMKDEKLAKVIQAGIYAKDIAEFYPKFSANFHRGEVWKLIQEIQKSDELKKCPMCGCLLGSHIATFSFNKSFRTRAFEASWKQAEDILAEANKWIFVGYSLPDADFAFAHLLKCVQKRNDNKEIVVVVLNDEEAKKRYESLFGKGFDFNNGGISEYIKLCSKTK